MAQANYISYTTMTGDTFDIIALDAYNDEYQAHRLIQANPQYAHVLVFSGGEQIKIPIVAQEAVETLPPWKR